MAAPFLLFPSPRNSPAFLLLPVIWIAGLLAKREPVPRTPLNLALLLLFVMLLVSEWATFDLMFSLPKITGMILGIAVFFAIVRAGQTTLGWWLSLLAFLGVGVSISVFGLIGTSWGAKISALDSFTEHLVLRIKGIPGIEEGLNPNQLAGALIWVLPVLVVLSGFVLVNHQHLLEVYGRRVRTTLVVAVLSSAILVLFTFVLTESRSAYIGFLLSMYAAISVSSSRRWRWLLLLVPLIGLIVVLMWQGSLSAIGERLVDGEVLDSPAFALNSLPGRFELWSRAIYGIQDFPFTGMGMNTFRKVVHVLYPLFNADPSTDIGHAHNEYLQAALDLGIPGLVAFLSVQMVTFAMILQTWLVAGRRTVVALAVQSGSSLIGEGALPRSLALGLGSGLLAHMIFGLTDATALGAKPGILFWMSLGLVTSLFLRVNSGAFLGYPILRDWRRS
ncbi:MAG: O-antigen ligase family protein [Chloroflexi bacterium]|nr:O-antigen ligase family protein [Chloroflexota bacterium]